MVYLWRGVMEGYFKQQKVHRKPQKWISMSLSNVSSVCMTEMSSCRHGYCHNLRKCGCPPTQLHHPAEMVVKPNLWGRDSSLATCPGTGQPILINWWLNRALYIDCFTSWWSLPHWGTHTEYSTTEVPAACKLGKRWGLHPVVSAA